MKSEKAEKQTKELYVAHQTKAEYDSVVAKNRAWWINYCEEQKQSEPVVIIGRALDPNDKFGPRLYAESVLERLWEE